MEVRWKRSGPGRAAWTLEAVTVVAVVMLAGCGGGGSSASKSTQVAVKVNKDEITVLQVNEQLSRVPSGVTADQMDMATRKILGNLVNQQLLVQQAIDRKLDRDPEVLGAIEAARLNILAQAYVQRVVSPQAKPTDQEVRKYYTDNPSLFGERKVYRLQELTIQADADQAKTIETAAGGMKSLKQLAALLREKNIPFSADSGVRTAEQLPLTQLPLIAKLKPQSLLVYSTASSRVNAIEVLASESQPVDDKKAAPVIEQFLANRKREELSATEIKRLRDSSKIEYVGDFVKFAGDPVPAPPAQAATAVVDKDANKDKGIAALR